MKHIVVAALVAAVLATVATPSRGSTNSAELRDIHFSFTDLDPADGIVPELIDVPGEVLSGFGFIFDGDPEGGPGMVTEGFLTAGTLDIPFEPSLSAGGYGSMSPGDFIVRAEATGTGTADFGGSSGGAYFVTPHTTVTLTTTAILQSIGGAGRESLDLCLGTCTDYQYLGGGTQVLPYSLTYTNDTDQYGSISAMVVLDVFASGVPEPSMALSMLAAGAFLVLRSARRGGRAATPAGR